MTNERITGKFLLNKFLLAFDFDTGFLLTLKELTIRPGNAIREYIEGNRKIYNPIKFLIIVFTISFLSASFLGSLDTGAQNFGYFNNESEISFYLGSTALVILATLIFNLLFRKRYNFFETITLFTYTTGYFIFVFAFITSIIGLILFLLTKNNDFLLLEIPPIIGFPFLFFYFFWVLKSFYKSTYLKTTFSVLIIFLCLELSTMFTSYMLRLTTTENPSRVGVLFRVKQNDSKLNSTTKSYSSFLVVDSVYANSGAEKAGLKVGDALLKINGNKTSLAIFNDQIKIYEVGETVLIEILRSGKRLYLPVALKHKDSLKMDL